MERARGEAERIYNELKDGNDPAAMNQSDGILFASFLDDTYRPHYTAHHRNDKGLANLKPLRIWDKKPLSDINAALVKSWRTNRLTGGTKAAMINRNLAASKAEIAFAVDEGLLAHHPLARLSRLPVEKENRSATSIQTKKSVSETRW